MVNCPKCEAAIDVEEEDIDEGDQLTCDECGTTLNVLGLDPIELETAEDEEDDDEDFDFDEDEDEDEEEEEEDWK
jgi:alpha-aminoadipate carrier protein LysW